MAPQKGEGGCLERGLWPLRHAQPFPMSACNMILYLSNIMNTGGDHRSSRGNAEKLGGIVIGSMQESLFLCGIWITS